jgi:hypothetical protein
MFQVVKVEQDFEYHSVEDIRPGKGLVCILAYNTLHLRALTDCQIERQPCARRWVFSTHPRAHGQIKRIWQQKRTRILQEPVLMPC